MNSRHEEQDGRSRQASAPGAFLRRVKHKLSFRKLIENLGLPWEIGKGYECPAGHGSAGRRCCRVHSDHAYCYHCKSCLGHLRLLQVIRRSSAADAVRALGEMAGVPVAGGWDTGGGAIRPEEERAHIVAARTEFARLAHGALTDRHREYLRRRGVDEATVDYFNLGSAVPGMIDEMLREGWPEQLIAASGLAVRIEDGLPTVPSVPVTPQVGDQREGAGHVAPQDTADTSHVAAANQRAAWPTAERYAQDACLGRTDCLAVKVLLVRTSGVAPGGTDSLPQKCQLPGSEGPRRRRRSEWRPGVPSWRSPSGHTPRPRPPAFPSQDDGQRASTL